MHLPNWRASYNMNDYRRVSCGKTSWSLNFNHMNISWFWLHMEIFAICLHLKLECEWRKIKGEESIGGIKKRLRNSTWIGERISLNWIKVYGFRQSSLLRVSWDSAGCLFCFCISIGISSFSALTYLDR